MDLVQLIIVDYILLVIMVVGMYVDTDSGICAIIPHFDGFGGTILYVGYDSNDGNT